MKANEVNVKKFGYTHLAYSFGSISGNGELEPYYGSTTEFEQYKLFNSMKNTNPGLKTLIAVGGWTFDQKRFVDVSNDPARRIKFAKSVVRFLETHKFDGIDLDWEYPVTRQGTPQDYDNYPLLCKALWEEFQSSGHPDWVISIATTINPNSLALGYDMVKMAPWVTFFNMMSYDIAGAWDSLAGSLTDMQYITNTMDHIIWELEVPRDKLVLGMAAYARSMRLTQKGCTTQGCPISGAGLTGCQGEPGFLPYFDVIDKYVNTGNYDSLITNPVTGSMEMVTGGGAQFTTFDSTGKRF